MRRLTLCCLTLIAVAGTIDRSLAAENLVALVGGSILDYPANSPPTAQLRALGPAAFDQLFPLRDELLAKIAIKRAAPATTELPFEIRSLERQVARLEALIDEVGKQRYCSRSRLFWYTDFDEAQAVARASGKPILSLRMLGNLNEDYSCANSRFFRTTLYANDEIAKLLRENYILHWKSVRPVPKVTIDFGDGRRLERTLTGNSIHYVLTPDGDVVEALPGLYGPQMFLAKISAALSTARQAAALAPAERHLMLVDYHNRQFREISDQFTADLKRVRTGATPATVAAAPLAPPPGPPPANVAAAVAKPKVAVERPLLAAALPLSADPAKLDDDNIWQAVAALHAEEARIDNSSRELIRSENPTAAIAGRLAITKRRVEDPLVRLVQTLESSIALDSVKNEYRFRRQIHQWYSEANYRPDVDTLNERVYAELFLTPRSDPWLGLAPDDVYTALPNAGVVTTK